MMNKLYVPLTELSQFAKCYRAKMRELEDDEA